MSNIPPSVTDSDVIPEVMSTLFEEHPESHLAVGIVAIGNNVMTGLEDEYEGYKLLRGNVYAWQKNYMPVEDLNEDGTESDPDDERSVHFVVVENALTSARVVGAMRLIIKSREDDMDLPIEEHYPEAFAENPAGLYSTEVSRLIGRHEDKRVQTGLKWLLFTAGVTYVQKHDLGPVFGAVEPSLARGLRIEGVPVTPLADAKYVPEFNAKKMPIRVDVVSLAEKMEIDRPELVEAMTTVESDFVYSGLAPKYTTKNTAEDTSVA